MRVLLINILAVEICEWLAFSVLFLGFPAREGRQNDGDFSCEASTSLFIASSLQRYSATALYAIMVYFFIKYGTSKMKWSTILPYIAVSWVTSAIIGSLTFSRQFAHLTTNGFCDDSADAPLGAIFTALIAIQLVVFLCIAIVFSILTFCYMKKNTLSGNVEVKRAVAKSLLYLVIEVIVAFLNGIFVGTFPIIKAALGDAYVLRVILLNYVYRVILVLISMVTPIAMLMLLKPLRIAVKQTMTLCKKNGADAQSGTSP